LTCIVNVRSAIVAGLVSSIAAIIVAISGCAIIEMLRAFFASLTTCFDLENNKFSGDKHYSTNAFKCGMKSDEKCACVIEDHSRCYDINWKKSNGCDTLLDFYPKYLGLLLVFTILCLIVVFIYSVLCCLNLTRKRDDEAADQMTLASIPLRNKASLS
jgi:hypothetical protein